MAQLASITERRATRSAAPRQHPACIEAERSLVAAVVEAEGRRLAGDKGPDVLNECGGLALAPMFSSVVNRELWKLICERRRHGDPNDFQSLSVAADRAVAGFSAADLATWLDAPATIALFEYNLRLVRDAAFRRAKIVAATELVQSLYDDLRPVSEWYAAAAGQVSQIDDQTAHRLSTPQIVLETMRQIDKLGEHGRAIVPGVPSGIADLDAHLGGFRPGDSVVLAGRPSMGKTALAVTCALNALRSGKGVGFISCEMPATTVVHRLLSQITLIDLPRLWRGPIGPQEYKRLAAASAELSGMALHIVDGEREWGAIVSHAQRLVGLGCDMLIVDYLGLLHVGGNFRARHEEIRAITREAKPLAVRLNVPLLMLAQINREAMRESDHRPRLHHLRDSGSIEEDADVILFPYRPHAHDDSKPVDEAEIIVAKMRNGPTGVIPVRWIESIARFEGLGDSRRAAGIG